MTTLDHLKSTAEPELEAYMLIRQISTVLETYHRYDLRSSGLTAPQFAILNLSTPEGVPLTLISHRMQCDNSNLTGIVDRLIGKGLVTRQADPNDRRVTLICLTPAGTELLRSLRPRYHASVKRRMQVLSHTQVHQLHDLLQALYQGLQSSDSVVDPSRNR